MKSSVSLHCNYQFTASPPAQPSFFGRWSSHMCGIRNTRMGAEVSKAGNRRRSIHCRGHISRQHEQISTNPSIIGKWMQKKNAVKAKPTNRAVSVSGTLITFETQSVCVLKERNGGGVLTVHMCACAENGHQRPRNRHAPAPNR